MSWDSSFPCLSSVRLLVRWWAASIRWLPWCWYAIIEVFMTKIAIQDGLPLVTQFAINWDASWCMYFTSFGLKMSQMKHAMTPMGDNFSAGALISLIAETSCLTGKQKWHRPEGKRCKKNTLASLKIRYVIWIITITETLSNTSTWATNQQESPEVRSLKVLITVIRYIHLTAHIADLKWLLEGCTMLNFDVSLYIVNLLGGIEMVMIKMFARIRALILWVLILMLVWFGCGNMYSWVHVIRCIKGLNARALVYLAKKKKKRKEVECVCWVIYTPMHLGLQRA